MRGFPQLDGYRAIAALLVVTTHVSFSTGYVLSQPFGSVFARFDIGVAIFFLLSGFLLYRPWAKRGLRNTAILTTPQYFRRRFWRIMPAYWVLLVVAILFLPTVSPTVSQIAEHVFFVQIYVPGQQLPGLTQVWSLAVEVAFYLALPVIGWLATRRRGDLVTSTRRQVAVIGACWFIGIVFTIIRTIGPLSGQLAVGYWLTSYLDWFAVGMFVAFAQVRLQLADPPVLLLRLQTLAKDTLTCLLAAAGLFVIACTPIAGTYTLLGGDNFGDLMRHLLYPLIAVLFLLPGFLHSESNDAWARFLRHPGMQFLGLISYGIFLWHLFVRDMIAYYLGINDFSGGIAWLLPLTVAVTILIAWISWLVVERPLIRYSRGPSIWTRLRSRSSESSTDELESTNPEIDSTANDANTIAP